MSAVKIAIVLIFDDFRTTICHIRHYAFILGCTMVSHTQVIPQCWLRQLDESGCRLKAKLIAPQGFLVSDALLSDAFAAVMDLEEAPGKTMWRRSWVVSMRNSCQGIELCCYLFATRMASTVTGDLRIVDTKVKISCWTRCFFFLAWVDSDSVPHCKAGLKLCSLALRCDSCDSWPMWKSIRPQQTSCDCIK